MGARCYLQAYILAIQHPRLANVTVGRLGLINLPVPPPAEVIRAAEAAAARAAVSGAAASAFGAAPPAGAWPGQSAQGSSTPPAFGATSPSDAAAVATAAAAAVADAYARYYPFYPVLAGLRDLDLCFSELGMQTAVPLSVIAPQLTSLSLSLT